MQITTCKKCNSIFKDFSEEGLCPVCRYQESMQMQRVKQFLQGNEEVLSIKDICEATGTEPDQIMKWIRRGEITLFEISDNPMTCKKCGMVLNEKNYCINCSLKALNALKSEIQFDIDKKKYTTKSVKENRRSINVHYIQNNRRQ